MNHPQPSMITYKNLSFGLMGIILGAIAISTFQYVTAWTAPTQQPPLGNVAAPLTTGNLPQTRNADLSLGSGASLFAGGSVAALTVVASQSVSAPQLCIGGDCRTAWPTTTPSFPSYGFGGVYSFSAGSCARVNVYTGACSCPNGYRSQSIGVNTYWSGYEYFIDSDHICVLQ